jgi:hypothetical protein
MLPQDLKPEQFTGYPTQARTLAVDNISILRELPLSFLPNLLREVIEYDYKFPLERQEIHEEISTLGALPAAQLREWFRPFRELSLPTSLERFDWLNQPAQFVEQLAAHLWSTHQMDLFRKAATEYGERIRAATPPTHPPIPRLGISIIGQDLSSYDGVLFRNLREHGTFFSNINPENGLRQLLDGATARAQAHPVPYGHWYVEGGRSMDHSSMLTFVSYKELEPARLALLRTMHTEIRRPGMGPEELRTDLAALQPAAVGLDNPGDAVLNHFQLKVLTEGSGTQIFSTTFAQWTAREALRRAQPLTLLVRFGPRQRERSMNELLSSTDDHSEPDLRGSLIDADMGAYYNWINQQRLPGANQSSFLAWFEGSSQAIAIGPSFARGASSKSKATLEEVLHWAGV